MDSTLEKQMCRFFLKKKNILGGFHATFVLSQYISVSPNRAFQNKGTKNVGLNNGK